MTTDAKCEEDLAGLFEVMAWNSCSRAAGQRDVLELSTAAETMVRREGTEIVSCLGPDRCEL